MTGYHSTTPDETKMDKESLSLKKHTKNSDF
ncbi:Uncharacterised protein [Salmonella enterica subsp. enterica serovar Bovismorbificans]|uniref:Uncharacterized protein n=1 Tax=Salmonella enterica subsp. enterica serovar Bovismorbificans TaxID=58097 RepID=A0A655CXV1_SALET|nr:Uncharacterised protein [Salmonella enterica subsp. enterica serovar Bovismorbificans]CNV14846.1 Uncharacterised protein [Salmonella enterica subsp. enterica serovar Bovismorbificans]CPR65750.1 Uncharacterised protein [Salmonella enterica subsp. enterica serovar Bovismorbificans]CQB66007.1 Uncharacterised protein [Salmonella enterica subsp. enterica serovar Bovismorbificans]